MIVILVVFTTVSAQKAETFDIITYKTPKGWQKENQTNALQFGKENADGGICLITLFKPLPANPDSKVNFESAWENIVEDVVTVSGSPQRQPAEVQNGWTLESGFANYESDGAKGIVMLLNLSGGNKMINILVLTNTDAFQNDIETFVDSIELPKIAAGNNSAKTNPVENQTKATPRKSNYKFTTTNFDDGWTATEQEDFVRVTKGNITVLIHYPNQKADAYNSVLRDGTLNAWNTLVAPRYSNLSNFELKPIQSFESIAFAEGDAVDKATGKKVHVVLFKKHYPKGNGRYIEFITNSKADFEREFGAYRNEEFGWEKLAEMQWRNKFAVSENDLVGKWSTSDYASLSYYYVNGGGFAGATATSTADEYTFLSGGNYQSDHSGSSGVVGSQKFSRQVYKGKFTADNWSLTLTNRFQDQTENYTCQFEAIKSGRILLLTDRNNTTWSLVKR